ncbi:uncharacterized protein BJX67DRAFT_384228 [Aspergillus lucknowensis]|uniref:Uncharacterized protein n=1 Tax=Aspergillus lucknowensis TaxID=176173 RepID=A0ABR4LHP0_9EURO
MPTRQTIPLEHDYIQAETSMLQLQLPHDDLDTNQAVEHASNIVEDFRVRSGPMPASDSLLPNIQTPNSVNGHAIISALSQPYFGTFGNIGDDAAQQSEPGPTGAPTVLPVTTDTAECALR